MILKNLWRRKTRTLLTMLGIAVGVAAVVAFSAFGEGFASGFENMFNRTDADLTVGQKDAMMLLLSSVDANIEDELLAIPGVEDLCGVVVGIIQMPETPYFIVMGEDPKGFTMAHYKIIEGQPLTGRKQILLGKTSAENFNKKPGEAFRLNDVVYRVAGIFETGVAMEDGGAVMRLDDAQRAFKSRTKVNYYNLKVEDKTRIDEIKKEIETRWPKLAATRAGEANMQSDSINMYRSFGWFMGIFAVAVGGLGMMNTTLMSVFERTREIGVLRAVGWSRFRIIGMIMGESLAVSILGGMVGILMGIGLTYLASLSPAVESLLTGVFTPNMFYQAMGTAVLLGTVGGIYPAWRAAQLAPVEAMRQESGASSSNLRVPGWARILRADSFRNLWRRPTRTLITASGIGIGVGFIISMISIVDGFIITFNQIAGAGQMDLLAEQANASDMSFSEIDERTAIQISGQPEVEGVSKMLLGFSTAPGLPYFVIYGADPAEEYVTHYRVREGRMFERDGEIIIGRFAANGLKKTVGENLRLSGATYKIVGIFENGSPFEDAGGLISYKDAQQLFNKPHKMSFLGIKLKPEYRDRAGEITEKFMDMYPDIMVTRSSEFAESLNDMATTYAMLDVIILLTIVVGGIVMTNAMLMSVFERTQEIGLLRALGWRRRRVIRMVIGEAIALSALSSILGFAIGVGLNCLILLEPTMGMFLSPLYSPNLFLEVFLLTVALGAVGGLYPAWRAANLRPIEALRYE